MDLFGNRPDASIVYASGTGQLQANPPVVSLRISTMKSSTRAVTAMGSSDLVNGEVHILGPSCQRYDFQMGRCGSIAFGSSPVKL